jgi:hypothetical protein
LTGPNGEGVVPCFVSCGARKERQQNFKRGIIFRLASEREKIFKTRGDSFRLLQNDESPEGFNTGLICEGDDRRTFGPFKLIDYEFIVGNDEQSVPSLVVRFVCRQPAKDRWPVKAQWLKSGFETPFWNSHEQHQEFTTRL